MVAKRGRPKTDHPKEHVSLRMDPDILAWLRSGGPGWRIRINDYLRDRMIVEHNKPL